jgi:hypothetical protein
LVHLRILADSRRHPALLLHQRIGEQQTDKEMKALKFFLVMLLAALAACSTDSGNGVEEMWLEESDPATNPAAILGRWDEVGGDWYFIFDNAGNYIQYNGQVTSGTYFFEMASNIIHCKVNGSDKKDDAFRINVTFESDKNLATFTTGSHTINVKRTQQ